MLKVIWIAHFNLKHLIFIFDPALHSRQALKAFFHPVQAFSFLSLYRTLVINKPLQASTFF
jgi:hypothetical protein